MTSMTSLLFYFFAALTVACALFVVLHKNPVTSALNLVVTFFGFGAIYAILGAHLMAALQVLVYAGAIMVLFVFVIMLLNADVATFDLKKIGGIQSAVLMVCAPVFCGMFIWIFKQVNVESPQGYLSAEKVEQLGGNTQVVAELLFSEYLFPFELTSVLLLAAIVGTVAIAKRNKRIEKGER